MRVLRLCDSIVLNFLKIINMKICINGEYLDSKDAKISVYDDCFLSGYGVYDTLRTYGGRIWQMGKHLERFLGAMKALGLSVDYSNRQIAEMISETIRLNGFAESKIRVTVSGGSSALYGDLDLKPNLIVMVEDLKPVDPELVRNGVIAITYDIERTLPEIKTCNLLSSKLALHEAHKEDAYEALLVDCKGHITEGSITNVFFVKDGDLLTPKNDILLGTTRDLIIELAQSENIKVHEAAVSVADLKGIQECFICNVTRGIVPVKEIKNLGLKFNIGEGVTERVQKLFADYIERFKKG